MSRRTARALFALLVSFCYVACGGGGGSAGDGPSSTVQITITDSPYPYGDVHHAVVAIRRIEIRGSDGVFRTLIDFDDEGGRGVDLVPLRNGITEKLGEVVLEDGLYDAIRVYLEARSFEIEDDDGVSHRFHEFAHDFDAFVEVRLDPPLDVSSGLLRELLLDVDLARSFIAQTFADGKGFLGFRFEPWIRAGDDDRAGSLTFRVKGDAGTPDDPTDDPWLAGAEFTLTSGDEKLMGGGASRHESDHEHPDLESDHSDDGPDERHGFVRHRALPAGEYGLRVAANGHEAFETVVVIVEGEETDLGTITLAKRDRSVFGRVFAQIPGKDEDEVETHAVASAKVELLFRTGGDDVASDRTNARGQYELVGVRPGEYVLRTSAPGYEGREIPVVVTGDEPIRVAVRLIPLTANVSGTVRNAAGNVEPRAKVRAIIQVGDDHYRIAETRADLDGHYTLADLPTGLYLIKAERDDDLEREEREAKEWLKLVGGEVTRNVDLTIP